MAKRKELLDQAGELGISGRNQMSNADLEAAINAELESSDQGSEVSEEDQQEQSEESDQAAEGQDDQGETGTDVSSDDEPRSRLEEDDSEKAGLGPTNSGDLQEEDSEGEASPGSSGRGVGLHR
jgi:hypothetical protein